MTPHWTGCAICSRFWLVPSGPKNAGATEPARPGNLSFEDALKKLESIVEMMESQDLPLEALLQKYEEGTALAKVCQDKLGQAELKIQQLEKNMAGELQLKPLPSESRETE